MTSKLTIPQEQIEKMREIRQKRLGQLKERAKQISLSPLPKGQSYKAIAISVDASNVPVETDVLDGVVLRCADSNNGVYFQDLVMTDGPVDEIEKFLDRLFSNAPVLRKLREKMKAPSWKVLTDFSGVVHGRSDLDRFVMELLEWGTLVTLAESSSQTILLKDGLLRGKAIKPQGDYLNNLRIFFDENCNKNGNFIIGIAKESSVLEKYKTLLNFVDGFRDNKGFYLKIPQELLQETYGWRYLAADITWGDLYFVRLQPHAAGRIMTLEIPTFLEHKLYDVLRILAAFPLRNLPERFRGLPDPIACAHENTNLLMNFGRSIQKEIMQ